MAVKLFVGSLSFSTSTERLRETFARIGSVESASVVTDRDTGRSRGFGFTAPSWMAAGSRSRSPSPEAELGEAGAASGAAVGGAGPAVAGRSVSD